jgi:hypothetical protein
MADGDVDAKITTTRAFPCNVFDGVDDYVEVPHDASQLGANLSNGFTISAWINPIGLSEYNDAYILDKSTGVTAENGFKFFYYTGAGNKFIMAEINAGVARSSEIGSVLFGVWKHVLVTISSASLANFYINGVLSGLANQNLIQTISTITTTNVIRIGNRSTATDRTFNGLIKDVKMWNRVLTADEMTLDYAGTLITNGLILNVPLQDDYNDKSPTGLTGTNSGTYLVNNLPNRIKADVNSLNLAAVTDKPIVVLPVGGRDAAPIVIGVNRSA